MEVRAISAAETYPLRRNILRPGFPPENAIYEGDDATGTAHFGCFVDGALVAVGSIYPEAPPAALAGKMESAFPAGALENSWRLRGMAVDTAVQRNGYGRSVLDACIAHIKIHGGTLFWCNARLGALEFYRRAGFETFGDEFEIPTVGAHYVMARGVGTD